VQLQVNFTSRKLTTASLSTCVNWTVGSFDKRCCNTVNSYDYKGVDKRNGISGLHTFTRLLLQRALPPTPDTPSYPQPPACEAAQPEHVNIEGVDMAALSLSEVSSIGQATMARTNRFSGIYRHPGGDVTGASETSGPSRSSSSSSSEPGKLPTLFIAQW